MNRPLPLAFAALLTVAPLASAEHPESLTFEGEIALGQPTTGVIGGVTEIFAPCDPDSGLNGLDGVWFDVTAIAGIDGYAFTLTMDDTLDADVWFYTADCGFINTAAGAQNGLGADEAGAMPLAAGFVVVDGFVGTGAFTLVIACSAGAACGEPHA